MLLTTESPLPSSVLYIPSVVSVPLLIEDPQMAGSDFLGDFATWAQAEVGPTSSETHCLAVARDTVIVLMEPWPPPPLSDSSSCHGDSGSDAQGSVT